MQTLSYAILVMVQVSLRLSVENAVDTSMGLTPLEGLVMGTRSGDVDPAVLQFICNHENQVDEMLEYLNKKSGLLGMTECLLTSVIVRQAAQREMKEHTCTGYLHIPCGQIYRILCSSNEWCRCNHIYSRCW